MTQDDLKARWFARLGYRLPNLKRKGRKALLERVEVGSHGGSISLS